MVVDVLVREHDEGVWAFRIHDELGGPGARPARGPALHIVATDPMAAPTFPSASLGEISIVCPMPPRTQTPVAPVTGVVRARAEDGELLLAFLLEVLELFGNLHVGWIDLA